MQGELNKIICTSLNVLTGTLYWGRSKSGMLPFLRLFSFDYETTSGIVEYEIKLNEIPCPQNHFDWGIPTLWVLIA